MAAQQKILITGGVRSGKSRYALTLAGASTGEKYFIATAQTFDQDMTGRIARHKEERSNNFITVEEPLYLAKALSDIDQTSRIIVIDCLTVWLNNLYHHLADEQKIKQQIILLVEAAEQAKAAVIFITNEVGLGIVPENKLGRTFIDTLGFLNQSLAASADKVILMTVGIPQTIKGKS